MKASDLLVLHTTIGKQVWIKAKDMEGNCEFSLICAVLCVLTFQHTPFAKTLRCMGNTKSCYVLCHGTNWISMGMELVLSSSESQKILKHSLWKTV